MYKQEKIERKGGATGCLDTSAGGAVHLRDVPVGGSVLTYRIFWVQFLFLSHIKQIKTYIIS